MSYFEWFTKHNQKHNTVIEKLKQQGFSKEQIIDYFVYENMAISESIFCPLYVKNIKCHNASYLNCFFCACPYFRFDDEGLEKKEGLVVKSQCAIDSLKALKFIHEGVEHLDCSKCTVPHSKSFVQKHFDDFTSPKV